MSKLKQLFTLALVALGIAAFAPLAQAEEKCTDCITFSADAPFGIMLNKGTHTDTPTVTLEYSTDQLDWKTFDVDTGYNAAQDGTTYKLHIRGTGNSTFAGSDFPVKGHSFTNTVGSAATAIACSGNALTLLDYATVAKGEKPTMNDFAFSNLFKGFAALTSAPALPATTLAQGCYKKMFVGCTSLTSAPALSATTLADYCYGSMFESCTSLTAAPALPATTLAVTCYGSMFSGCTSLTSAPALSATTLADYCYFSMFIGCTSLTSAPALPATNLAASCYASMFRDCTALTSAPALSATNLAQGCYQSMFKGCTSLKVDEATPGKEWKIPATTGEGATDWGKDMFKDAGGTLQGTPALNTPYYIASAPVALAAVTKPENATVSSVTTNGAAATVPCTITYNTAVAVTYTADEGYMFAGGYRTFTTNVVMDADTVTVTLTDDQKPVAAKACADCLAFSADAAFGIKMTKKGAIAITPNLEYSTDQIYWSKFDWEIGAAAGADNTLYLRGTNNTAFAEDTYNYYAFTNTVGSAAKAIACSGNIMTLLDYEKVAKGEEPTMNDYTFLYLFYNFAALTTAPALPATNLTQYCYNCMFNGCTSLTAAPALPATNLAEKCYNCMFKGCTSLTAAPELPATNLASSCYYNMFQGCTSLTAAPELHATNLAGRCCLGMFQGCTSLTAAPALPATTLAKECYASMFKGCTALTSAPALSATNLASSCYSSMFQGCTSLTAAPALPATNLAEGCYDNMFYGCTSLTAAPALPATNLATKCYNYMFNGCTALVVNTNAPGKAWLIPSDAATSATKAEKWNFKMFTDTSGNITNATVTPGVKYYVVEPVKIPYDEPKAVENTTHKVCMGGEEVTDGMVWSNRTGKAESPADPVATVVYTANAGYAFEDGTTEKAVAFDTRVSPAVLTRDAPEAPGKTELQLGVVAQRYPWNGVVDVEYKAAYWSDAVFGAVEIACDDVVVTNALNIFKSGTGVQPVDLKAIFGEKAGNAQFKAVLSVEPSGFAEAKTLPAGSFPAAYADEAYEFKAMDTVEGSVSPYGSWFADLVVSFDRAIAKDTVKVSGQFGESPWFMFELPAMAAGEEVAVVKDLTPFTPPGWNYCCKTIQAFNAGVKNLSSDNTGAKVKVVLRLTSNEDATKTLDVTTIETTLVEPAAAE